MPSMPTATDEKIAGDLAAFRLEAEKRFGAIDTALSDIRGDLKGVRSDLGWIKLIGGFLVALLVAAGGWSGRVIWDAATIASDVRQQGQRLDKVERRLDGIDAKLDTLISRTAPAPKPGG
jgi:hypothetical protein